MRQKSQRLTQIHLSNLIVRGRFVPLLLHIELQFTHSPGVQTPIATDPQTRGRAKKELMAHFLAHDMRHTMGG